MSYSFFKHNAGLIASKKPHAVVAILTAALLVSACDSSMDRPDTDGLSLGIPERIRNVQAIDPTALTVIAIVNGVEVVLNPVGDGTFRGEVSVPANSVVPVNIQFTEQVNGQALVLATQAQQISTGDTDNRVTLRRSAYNFDAHDADGDSVSNIIEREESTDPRDANDAPPMVNVNVVASQPADAGGDSNNFTVEASIGNSVRTLERSGNQFVGNFFTVDRSPVTVSAEFVEDVTGQRLSVASQSYELSSIFDQQTITFSAAGYQLTNRDNDGQTDLAEVVAGTSIFENSGNGSADAGSSDSGNVDTGNTGNENTGDEPPEDVSFITTFDIPAAIQDAGSVYAEYRIDGQLVGLIRDTNSFTATYTIAEDATPVLDIILLDNFNGNAYVVAQARKTLPIASNQQLVQFVDSDFDLLIDTDNDNVPNYIEREQGTNPLTADNVFDNGGNADTCDATTSIAEFAVSKDVHVQNSVVVNDVLLRVNSNNRVALLAFPVTTGTAVTGNATLAITIGDDEGNGTVNVSQIENFQWAETDSELLVPQTGAVLGSLTGDWLSGQQYLFNLANINPGANGELTLMLSQVDGNDFALLARESGTSAMLAIELNDEDCNEQ